MGKSITMFFFALFAPLFLFLFHLSAVESIRYDLSSDDAKLSHVYENWMVLHRKAYRNNFEKETRFHIFKENLVYIEHHNQKNESYHLGLNQFADLTHDEFKIMYLGGVISNPSTRPRSPSPRYQYTHGERLPRSVDWRKKGAVTPVKNQGGCVARHSLQLKQLNELVSLSEQELVDCDTSINQGCNGGMMDLAFQFIINNGGINSEEDYPYQETDGTCDIQRKNSHVAKIDGYEDMPANDEMSLKKAAAHQPISVAIEATGQDFQFYKS
ncbi:hypothetical protein KI387_014173, partial [Taxus chinensis]